MTCPKYHGFCDAFGAVGCGGDCARCKDRATANALTLREWEAQYRQFAKETGAVCHTTVKTNVSHLHRFMATMHLTAEDSMAKIDRTMAQNFYLASNDLQPVSRKGVIESLQKMASERFVQWAKAMDLQVSQMPSAKGLAGGYERYKQISAESMKRLRDLQWEYRQSNDPRKWIMLTLALDFGMSKADILRAKWGELFTVENGVTLVSYCRVKTGKLAMWKISDEHLRDFGRAEMLARALAGKDIKANTKESMCRIGGHDRDRIATSRVWDLMNDDLRKTVPEWRNTPKAAHCLRKEFATMVCRKYGWEVGEIATGDTVKILQKSYVGKMVVDWKTM